MHSAASKNVFGVSLSPICVFELVKVDRESFFGLNDSYRFECYDFAPQTNAEWIVLFESLLRRIHGQFTPLEDYVQP